MQAGQNLRWAHMSESGFHVLRYVHPFHYICLSIVSILLTFITLWANEANDKLVIYTEKKSLKLL